MTSITRKQFLATLLGAAGAATLAACGGDESTPDSGVAKSCTTNGTNVNIASNHGHVLAVSAADVTAGADKTYDITGTSAHSHMVTVTAANFTSLKNNPGMSVQVTSTSGGGHTHMVTIMCA